MYTRCGKKQTPFEVQNLPSGTPANAKQIDFPEKAPGLGNSVGTPVFNKHWLDLLSQVNESQSAFLVQSSPHSSQLEISVMGLPISEPYKIVLIILQGLPTMINSIRVQSIFLWN